MLQEKPGLDYVIIFSLFYQYLLLASNDKKTVPMPRWSIHLFILVIGYKSRLVRALGLRDSKKNHSGLSFLGRNTLDGACSGCSGSTMFFFLANVLYILGYSNPRVFGPVQY